MAGVWDRRFVRGSAVLAIALMLMLAFTITPMRTLADDFLDQFRVHRFVAVTIPMDMVEPMKSGILENLSDGDRAAMQDQFSGLGTFATTFDTTHLPTPVTMDEATTRYGDVDVPDEVPSGFGAAPQVYVTDAGTATYEVNVNAMQALIDETGMPIYAFDAVKSETLTFGVNVPIAVVLTYTSVDGAQLVVGQMDSPTLLIPDDFDMNRLREDMLRLPGLPTDLVAQLRSIEDWEHTLVVPVPEGATSRDVTVNGSAGLLIEYPAGATVLWEKGGILYAVGGHASADDVLETADSMQ